MSTTFFDKSEVSSSKIFGIRLFKSVIFTQNRFLHIFIVMCGKFQWNLLGGLDEIVIAVRSMNWRKIVKRGIFFRKNLNFYHPRFLEFSRLKVEFFRTIIFFIYWLWCVDNFSNACAAVWVEITIEIWSINLQILIMSGKFFQKIKLSSSKIYRIEPSKSRIFSHNHLLHILKMMCG